MKMDLYKSRLYNLLKQRNLLMGLAVSLLALNFMQMFLLIGKEDRVVVAPLDVRQEFWVQKNRVSKSYLEEMSVFFSDMLLETTASGAAFRREIILRHVTSSSYGSLKSQLMAEEIRFKKGHLSTSFQATEISVNAKKLTTVIKGDLITYVGKKRISQSREEYQFEFDYRFGRLLIKSFTLIGSEKKNEH